MNNKQPHHRLISVAAELARGPNLDERFDLDDRLPKSALRNIERICDRQRELCCIIRDNADKLRQERDALDRELTALKDMLIEVRRVYRPSGARGQLVVGGWVANNEVVSKLPEEIARAATRFLQDQSPAQEKDKP